MAEGHPLQSSAFRSNRRLLSHFILFRPCQGNDVYKAQGNALGTRAPIQIPSSPERAHEPPSPFASGASYALSGLLADGCR